MYKILTAVISTIFLSGCFLTLNIQNEGTVSNSNQSLNCTTENQGTCQKSYNQAGTETLIAKPGDNHVFTNILFCLHRKIDECETYPWNQENADSPDNAVLTATFEPSRPPVREVHYTYNALGQRITKTVNTVTTIFQYDLDGNLIGEFDSSGQIVRHHIHLDGEPVAQISTATDLTETIQYVHTDHLGTPTLLTDSVRQVVADVESTPFGDRYIDFANANLNGTVIANNGRFPGQYRDEETGLHYNYFRDYDPSLGRYVQADPIGQLRDYGDPQLGIAIAIGALTTTDFADEAINHSYGYVGQKPLNWLDNHGLARTHTKNRRKSNLNRHQDGNTRRAKDQGGEKADSDRGGPRRPKNKRPKGHKGKWPQPPKPTTPSKGFVAPSLLGKVAGTTGLLFHSPGTGGCVGGYCADELPPYYNDGFACVAP